jgi:hypothetical protein
MRKSPSTEMMNCVSDGREQNGNINRGGLSRLHHEVRQNLE